MNHRRLIFCWGLLLPFVAATGSAQLSAEVPISGLLPYGLAAFPNLPPGLQPRLLYLQTDFVAEHTVESAGSPSASVSHDRIIVQPVLGLGMAGSIYHPNLLEYAGVAELGLDYQDSKVVPGDQVANSRFLERYHVAVDLLRQKPYATGFYANKEFAYRDFDFFYRVPVESESFGVHSGYAAGVLPFSIAFQHYQEDIQDPTRPTLLTEDTFSFNGNNLRRLGKGSTQINYNLNEFTQQDDGFSNHRGLNQNLCVFDGEDFGSHDWIHLSSLLNCNSVTETTQPAEKLLFQEYLQLQHTRWLRSFYDYEFDVASFGDANASTQQGRVGLTQQTFANLTSTVDAHGHVTHAASPGSTLDTTRYGGALNEQYTRTLGTWGDFTLGYTGGIDHEQRVANGTQVEILNEAHTLTDGGPPTLLAQLFVVESTIQVTDTNITTYRPGIDFSVIAQGAMTEIRRIPGGTLTNGSRVLVTYSAALQPSDEYTAFENGVYFRLDFGKGLFGIYGRWNSLDFSGGEQLNLRWLKGETLGVDSTWRWLRAGAEYQVVNSNISPFNRTRLFESAQFQPSELATLSFDLYQSWTMFPDTNARETSYGLITRYQQRLTSNLAWSAEAGGQIQRGSSFDWNLATIRTELNWAVGKLKVKLGYEYGNERHPADLTTRHYCYLQARRTF